MLADEKKTSLVHKLIGLYGHLISKKSAVSPGGVEYNPIIFNDSISLSIELRNKIEAIESESEVRQDLYHLKQQINSITKDANQSILEIYAILQRIEQVLNQYSRELKNSERHDPKQPIQQKTLGSGELSLRGKLAQVNQFKKEINKYRRALLSKQRNLKKILL